MSPNRLIGLAPKVYEHPLDAKTLDILRNTKGVDLVIQKLNEWGLERLIRVQLTGSYLKVTATNLREIYEMVHLACEVLEVQQVPDVFLAPSGDINATTLGVVHPSLVLNAGVIENLTPEEVMFVIGHEVAHVKSGHLLYYQVAEVLPQLVHFLAETPTFGIGDLLSLGLQYALQNWKRMSKLTADRGGLLTCQDPEACLRTLVKLSGLPKSYYQQLDTAQFVDQAREFEALDLEKVNTVAKWLSGVGQTHPWTVMRANQILSWMENGGYARALEAPNVIPVLRPPGIESFCSRCGQGLHGTESFCTSCGTTVPNAEGEGNASEKEEPGAGG